MVSSSILREFQSLVNARNYAQARYSIARRAGDKGIAQMRHADYMRAQQALDHTKARIGIEYLTDALSAS